MSWCSSAARTNLSSQNVSLNRRDKCGEGHFRLAYVGTYIGGNRNQQEAVCKCFKNKYSPLEAEFFRYDYKIADRAIDFCDEWNRFCESKKEIMMTKGDVMTIQGKKYMVEPLIRYFTKYTSNNGWVDTVTIPIKATGVDVSSPIPLTDPAICSRIRNYGPTDLGEKGIETFFANHECNRFCHANGQRWSRPRAPSSWFCESSSTSMLGESATELLRTRNNARFTANLAVIYDNYDSDASTEEDEVVSMRF